MTARGWRAPGWTLWPPRGAIVAAEAPLTGPPGSAFAVEQVQFELRFLDRPGNPDGQDGAGALLTEERIDRLQEERLEAGRGLRNLRPEPELTREVELFPAHGVVPRERHTCAVHGELEARQPQHPVAHRVGAAERRHHVVNLGVLGFALAAAAEFVDFVLHEIAREPAARDREVARQLDRFNDRLVARRQLHRAGEGELATHRRLVLTHHEINEVLEDRKSTRLN